MNWYVIRVATGKEKKVKDLIEFELNDKNVSVNLKIPMENKIVIRKGKKVNTEKSFFPGYIFVECNSISEVEGIIKNIKGVSSILKQPLTEREINRFLIKKEKEENNDDVFYENQKVKIIDGPFSTMIGTVQSVDNKSKTAKVNIILFDRENIVELSFSQIAS
jgi:transcriptional antiterminator NusG